MGGGNGDDPDIKLQEATAEVAILATTYIVDRERANRLKASQEKRRDRIIVLVSKFFSGEWSDDEIGTAKMRLRNPSISFDAKIVDSLATVWAASTDPVMASCGKLLLDARSERAGYDYLEVRKK